MWGQSEVQEVWGSEETARERLHNLCEVKERNYLLVFTRIKTWHRPLTSLWICDGSFFWSIYLLKYPKENASNGISESQNMKIFWGIMPPDSPARSASGAQNSPFLRKVTNLL